MVNLALFVTLILISLFINKSRLMTLVVFLFLGYLTFTSTSIADNLAYENIYQAIGAGQKYTATGYGWWLLCQFGNKVSMNFMAFKTVIFLISLVLIWFTFLRMNINDNFIIAAYAIYPALTDIIQIRFFFGSSIVIFFMYYLWKKNNIYGVLIYIIGVILAGQIHNAMYFFLIFAVWKVIYKYRKTAFLFLIVLLLLFFVDKSMLINVVTTFGSDQENQFYFTSQYNTSILHSVSFVFTTLFFSFVSIYIVRNQNSYLKNNFKNDEIIGNFLRFMCIGNCISIFIVLMGAYSFTFLRLQKPFWVLNYLEIAIIVHGYDYKQKFDPKILQVIYILLAIIWLLNSEQQAISDFFFVK